MHLTKGTYTTVCCFPSQKENPTWFSSNAMPFLFGPHPPKYVYNEERGLSRAQYRNRGVSIFPERIACRVSRSALVVDDSEAAAATSRQFNSGPSMAATVDIKLSRSNRIYRASEPLEGKIVIKSPSSLSHQAVRLSVNASVNLQVRGGSAGVIESFYGVVKPILIVKKSVEVRSSGKIEPGSTEIPFSINLKEREENNYERFYETFHGSNISIQYLLNADIVRGYLHKSLSAAMEFIVESDQGDLPERPVSPEMVIFYITQDTQRHPLLPELKSGGFRVTGKMCTQCSLLDPISGELNVEASSVPITSIDIHLLRVESILVGEKIVTETSLIQSTQIADGDVCRNMTLPIYVMLPRLLTCPTVFAGPFSIEFKVCMVVSFESKLAKSHPKSDPTTPRLWLAMEKLPLELIRTK